MNIKRGLKRFSVVVSVIWVISISVLVLGDPYSSNRTFGIYFGIGGLLLWWGLLYMGFWVVPWVISGFSSDDKKKGETDE